MGHDVLLGVEKAMPRMGSKPVSVLMRVPTEARSMAIDS